MAAERQDASRELRLEGPGLFAVGGLLLALIVGAFFLGRWVESRNQAARPVTAKDGPGPLSQVVETADADDADRDANFFDRVEGQGKQVEPEREARARDDATSPSVRPEPATPAPPPAAATPARGSFYVQVFAGKDRGAAEKMVDRLQNRGYEVRLFDRNGPLLRVRVGGYPTEAKARLIAADLRESGYSDAFVTRVE